MADAPSDDETRELCIEVGRTLLMCALVERHIKHLSRSFKISEWLDFKASDINIGPAIDRMRKQYGLDDEFVLVLHEFRENRNKFVHQIWDLAPERLNTEKGRRETMSFIVALYTTASVLNRILFPPVLARYEATGQRPPDWKPILLSTPRI